MKKTVSRCKQTPFTLHLQKSQGLKSQSHDCIFVHHDVKDLSRFEPQAWINKIIVSPCYPSARKENVFNVRFCAFFSEHPASLNKNRCDFFRWLAAIPIIFFESTKAKSQNLQVWDCLYTRMEAVYGCLVLVILGSCWVIVMVTFTTKRYLRKVGLYGNLCKTLHFAAEVGGRLKNTHVSVQETLLDDSAFQPWCRQSFQPVLSVVHIVPNEVIQNCLMQFILLPFFQSKKRQEPQLLHFCGGWPAKILSAEHHLHFECQVRLGGMGNFFEVRLQVLN